MELSPLLSLASAGHFRQFLSRPANLKPDSLISGSEKLRLSLCFGTPVAFSVKCAAGKHNCEIQSRLDPWRMWHSIDTDVSGKTIPNVLSF